MVLSLSAVRLGRALPVAVAAALSLAAACGDEGAGSGGPDAGSPVVLATTSIWADVIGELTCNGEAGVTVETLMPPGVDPHQYEPSLQDRQRLEGAGLVVANGAGLETGVTPLLDSVDADLLVTITEMPGLQLLAGSHEDEGHPDEAGDEEERLEEDVDPHVWLDPTIVAASIDPLADAVVEAVGAGDGVDADAIADCAEAYGQQLEALDAEIEDTVGALPERRRVLVTNHDAYGYFAERYGFDVVGTVIPSTSTMAETNAVDLQELSATIGREDVPAIFVDADHDGAEAENLARSVDVEVVRLAAESLGDGGGTGSYVELMRTNTRAIVDALAG
ncbi:MAG: metal ABC transporter substrate-binding protein [Ilumatobacteraceae bacterium]